MQTHRRTQGLLIEELPEETVVYDTTRHEAHCLNRAATLVWHHCDGRTSPSEMAEILRKELDLPADETMVRLILEQLEELHLLLEERPAGSVRSTRRNAAKQLALIGLSSVVMTIAVPLPAAHASTTCGGMTCSGSTPCCCTRGGGMSHTCVASSDPCSGGTKVC
jgi:hypothetical protein